MLKKSLLIFFLFVQYWSFGQEVNNHLPDIYPLTPNSSALAKFGDFPVSHYNGTADVSIPLYTIQVGDLTVPITLRYNTSGIRVSEVASWVGLGWSLDAGYSISRKIVGRADDDSDTFKSYFYGHLLDPLDFYNLDDGNRITYYESYLNGNFDTDPDIYSYNLMNSSGKFFFDGQNDFQIRKVPFSPDSIMYGFGYQNRLYFNMLDGDGNYYVFGQSTDDKSFSYNETSSDGGVTTWNVDTLISANRKDKILFKYNDVQYYDSYKYYHRTIIDNASGAMSLNLGAVTSPSISRNMTESYIETINYDGGKVEFIQSLNGRSDFNSLHSLDSIKVYSYDYSQEDYNLQKVIKFYVDYFDSDWERLKLDSVGVFSGSGEKIEMYRFEYNTDVNLPLRFSASCDKWGYYNGKNNYDLIPQMTINYINDGGTAIPLTFGSDLSVNSYFAQANILEKVYYPSGGYSEFEYESNRYSNINETEEHLVGGLRIKSIKSYETAGANPVIKTYEYGSGISVFHENNYSYSSEFSQNYIAHSPYAYYYRSRTYSSNPVTDIIPFDGSIVFYPSVTEYIGDDTSNTGKTDYEYYYDGDEPNVQILYAQIVPTTSHFYNRGLLKKKKSYKNIGGNYYPVSQDSYRYSAFGEGHYTYEGFRAHKWYITNDGYDSYSYSYYTIDSDDNYLTQKKERIYNESDTTKFVETITDYDYDNFRHQQVSKTTTINSVGDTLVTNYKYPADYPGGNEALDYMVDNNMQAYPIETYSEVNSDITSAQLTEYRINTNSGNVVANSVKILEGEEPFSGSSFTESSVSGGNLTKDSHYSTIPEIAYDNYDDNNTLREYTSRGEDKVAVVWGYNKTQPVLKVEGMGYNSISSTIKTYLQNDNNLPSEWDDYQAVKTKVDMIISHLSTLFNNTSCQATLYTYAPAVGVTSVTLPNKTTTYYEYDSEGRLIKVLNDDGALVEYYDYHYVTGAPVELEMPVLGLDVEFLDFQAGSDGLSFSITSNTSWTITEDCSWLSLSQASGSGDGSVTVYATDNAGDAIRTDTIVVTNGQGLTKIITVSQEACELELSSNSVSFSSSGGNRTVTVLNDCCGWTASDNRSWISTSSSGDNLSIHASSNSSTSSRSGYVTVTSETGEIASIYVSQSGAASCTLTVSPSSISVPASGGNGYTINVSSSSSWSPGVSGNCNITNFSYNGSRVTFDVGENSDQSTKSSTITITGCGGSISRTVSISQAAGTIPYTLTVSPSSFSLSSGSSSNTITVSSNDSWSVSEYSDPNNMLSLSTTSGSGDGSISFGVSSNGTTSSRSATIRVTGNNSGITRYISISQAAASPTLSVSPTSFSVGALSSTKMINVSSNTSWVVSESESWIDLVYTNQGTGNGSFGISTWTLNSGSRYGFVTVQTTDGSVSRTIMVYQYYDL